MLDGIRINSPFYLAKLKIPKTDQVERYTLVVSEYEKTHDITFTIEGKFENISPFRNSFIFLNSKSLCKHSISLGIFEKTTNIKAHYWRMDARHGRRLRELPGDD